MAQQVPSRFLFDEVARGPSKFALPSETSLVHGDYRLGNLISEGDEPTIAIRLELSTRGDPLTDPAHCSSTAPPGVRLTRRSRSRNSPASSPRPS